MIHRKAGGVGIRGCDLGKCEVGGVKGGDKFIDLQKKQGPAPYKGVQTSGKKEQGVKGSVEEKRFVRGVSRMKYRGKRKKTCTKKRIH